MNISRTEIFGRKSKSWIIYLSNYATKSDLKNTAGIEIKIKVDLASLIYNLDRLDNCK